MTAVRYVLVGAVAYGLFVWLLGRFLNVNDDTYVCGHCLDEGRLTVNTTPPETRWCNFCMLGRQLEAASKRRCGHRVLP